MELLQVLAGTVRDPDLGADRLQRVPPAQVPQLIELARAHGVEAWLAGVAPRRAQWAPLLEQRTRFVAARLRARADLDRFGDIAGGLALPWLAVKGQAAGETLYPRPDFRYGVDTDVLVPPSRFAELSHALLEAGWRQFDLNWPLFERTAPGQLRFLSPLGGLFDIHWHVMDDPILRRTFDLPTEALLGRRRVLPSGLPVLDPIDQLLHLAVHAALSGANRLCWLLDTGLAAEKVGEAPELARRTTEAHAEYALSLVLDRAHRWFDTPRAPMEMTTGVSALWSFIGTVVDRVSPLSDEPDQPAVARSFARSVRGSGAASIAEFTRHLTAFALSGAPRVRPLSPLTDPNDPRSPRYPVSDDVARDRYLARVAAG